MYSSRFFSPLWLYCLILPVLIGCGAKLVTAQGTQADYDRLAKFPKVVGNKVFRDRIEPNWIHDDRAMWYRVQVAPDRHEFYLVNLKSGKRESVFNAVSLAKSLEVATGKKVNANALPFAKLLFDESLQNVFFRCEGKHFRVQRETGALMQVTEDQVPKSSGKTGSISPSGSGRTPVHVAFTNHRQQAIQIYWIDTRGRAIGYGEIPPGKTVSQPTFLNHTWVATDQRQKPLDVIRVATGGQKILIRENSAISAKLPPIRRSPRNRISALNVPEVISPDRKWRVEIRNHNVILLNLENNTESQLTTDGTESDYYTNAIFWSPDSSRLVVVREVPPQEHKVYMVESAPRGQLQPKLNSMEYLKPGDRIRRRTPRLFDIQSKKQIEVSDHLFENPWRLSDFRWAADSSEFFFRYNQRGHQVMRIVGISSIKGKTRSVIEEKTATFIDYNYKFKFVYLDRSDETIWSSERDGWNHLYLYNSTTGELKNQITRGKWLVRKIEFIDEEKRQIWFQAGGIIPNQDPYYIHHCRVNFDGSGLVVMTKGDGTHNIRYSPTKRFLLDRYSRVDLPPVHEVRDVETGNLVARLEKGDDSLLLKTGWKKPERFVAMGRDGTTPIYGVIYRPSNFDPKKKYPLIEYIYAGPHGSFVPKSFAPLQSSQSLAELGFVVVQIDGMGTSNRSKKFHDVCWKNLGDSGFPDRIRWIKSVANRYPYIDISRVGIYGGSAGGQSATRALLAHGDFYHVAVSDCGCHDNRMDKIWWNEQWMGWPIGPHYAEQSNVTQAHRLQGKLFLIVGELDRNVDPASTLQVVDALIKANKDFDFLLVPGGGHGIGSRPYGRRRTFDFFVRHLHGVEPRSTP